MKLEGQGALGRSSPRDSLDERGYIMVVLLIGMGVAAIWMSAALPAWRQQALREKEADLVFRGEQYARAIALFYTKNNNTLPPNIDILVSGKYLRKKWKDPITGLDFMPVGSALPGQGGSGPVGPSNPTGGRGPTSGFPSGPVSQPGGGTSGPRGGGPISPAPGGAGGPGTGQPGPGRGPIGAPGQTAMQTGISGVRSQSQATSIRLYQGQQIYSAWPFDYAQMIQRIYGAPGGVPGGGRPGGPAGGRGPLAPGGIGNPPGRGGPGGMPTGPGGPGRGPGGGPVGPGGGRGPMPGGRGGG